MRIRTASPSGSPSISALRWAAASELTDSCASPCAASRAATARSGPICVRYGPSAAFAGSATVLFVSAPRAISVVAACASGVLPSTSTTAAAAAERTVGLESLSALNRGTSESGVPIAPSATAARSRAVSSPQYDTARFNPATSPRCCSPATSGPNHLGTKTPPTVMTRAAVAAMATYRFQCFTNPDLVAPDPGRRDVWPGFGWVGVPAEVVGVNGEISIAWGPACGCGAPGVVPSSTQKGHPSGGAGQRGSGCQSTG